MRKYTFFANRSLPGINLTPINPAGTPKCTVTAVTDPKAIEEELNRILSSPEFEATARQKKFLRFVTQMFLEGRAGEIKGYTVATDVFGRK